MSIGTVRLTKDYIEVACDSQVTWGDCKMIDGMYGKASKIIENEALIAVTAGSTQQSAFFSLYSKERALTRPTEETILQYMLDFEEWGRKRINDFKLDNQFILIIKRKVFAFNWYEVTPIKEYGAIGSGMFIALGALYKGSSAKEAAEVAAKFDNHCSGKIITRRIWKKSSTITKVK